MINIIEEFGRNAGELWKTLNTHGPLPETKLMENARLQEDEFYVAIGWLARENKVCKTVGNILTKSKEILGALKAWTG